MSSKQTVSGTDERSDDRRRLIDDRELARILGWNKETPSVLRGRGKMPIPFIRVGRRIRYRLADVDAFLEASTERQQPAPVATLTPAVA